MNTTSQDSWPERSLCLRGVPGPYPNLSLCCFVFLLSGCTGHLPGGTITFADHNSPAYGKLYLPAREGPHPVVIDLHGCSGIRPARNKVWLPRLLGAGFAVLQVDSLSPRGVDNICGDAFRVSPMIRSMDAAAALRRLMRDRRFDRRNIFLFGVSHGATAALLTQVRPGSVFSHLSGVIAFYPYCYDELPVLNSDLLVLIGDQDDRAPAARCRDMRIGDRAGHTYELVVYPGAYHGFDVPALIPLYHGHRVGYNAVAAKDSVRRVMRFLRARLQR